MVHIRPSVVKQDGQHNGAFSCVRKRKSNTEINKDQYTAGRRSIVPLKTDEDYPDKGTINDVDIDDNANDSVREDAYRTASIDAENKTKTDANDGTQRNNADSIPNISVNISYTANIVICQQHETKL